MTPTQALGTTCVTAGVAIGFGLGLMICGGLSHAWEDEKRPYFGFTQDGIAPIDKSGNQYGNSYSPKSQAFDLPSRNPC